MKGAFRTLNVLNAPFMTEGGRTEFLDLATTLGLT